jgi:acyl phosphate:glycerol-3-phosphate acyltransferase
MTFTLVGLLALASYLLGAIPFGLLVARSQGVDIRRAGSGNIGATNVFRCVGRGWGLLTFLCDALKGFAAAFVFPLLLAPFGAAGPSPFTASLVGAVAAVVGHNWPVYLRFRGGKGVATSAGALLGVAWQPVAVALAVWLALFAMLRYVSVASMLAAAGAAAYAWRMWNVGAAEIGLPVTLSLLAALTVWRHRGNIQRLARGQEPRAFAGRHKRPGAANADAADPSAPCEKQPVGEA